jgi:hypothetical protein
MLVEYGQRSTWSICTQHGACMHIESKAYCISWIAPFATLDAQCGGDGLRQTLRRLLQTVHLEQGLHDRPVSQRSLLHTQHRSGGHADDVDKPPPGLREEDETEGGRALGPRHRGGIASTADNGARVVG